MTTSLSAHKSFHYDAGLLRQFLSDAHSRAVRGNGELRLRLTCLRAANSQQFWGMGHAQTFEAPIQLFETLETLAGVGHVFRCYQFDGFVVPEAVSIENICNSFPKYPLAYSIVSVAAAAKAHRNQSRTVDWISMHAHRGIAEATAQGAALNCTTPSDVAEHDLNQLQ